MSLESELEFELTFSILEIYNETVNDYLSQRNKFIKIKEDKQRGVYFENLTESFIGSKEEINIILDDLFEKRSLSKINSNSHMIYLLKFVQKFSDESTKKSILTIVDLAAIEKTTNLDDGKLNISLCCLSNVVNNIANNQTEYVPYKDSKLTRIIKDSLGGNTKTTIIICCSQFSFNVDEILQSFNFANRANIIKNKVRINIKRNPYELEKIITSLNEKLKVANAEIKKFNYLNTNNNTKRINIVSPVKFKHAESIPLSNTPNTNLISFNHSSVKLMRKPYSLVSESLKGNKSKSTLLDNNNLDIKESIKDDFIQNNFEEKESQGVSSYFGADLTIIKNYTVTDKLKENLENLKNENKLLKEKIAKLEEHMNILPIVEKIENSFKNSLKELEEFSTKFHQESYVLRNIENDKLKELLSQYEEDKWNEFKKRFNSSNPTGNTFEIKEIKNLYKKFLEVLQNDENYFKSYGQIYQNMKYFSNKLLIDYQKPNTNELHVISEDEIITLNKRKYLNLKNNLIKSNSLLIFYEKLINDLLDKFSLDLSK